MTTPKNSRKCEGCGTKKFIEWDNGCGLVFFGCQNKFLISMKIYQYRNPFDEMKMIKYFQKC